MRGFTYALREDLLGRPIRVTTVDPGLVETEFSRVRFRGDEEKARCGLRRRSRPMTAEDVADCILFAVTRPPHVNVDEIVVKALAQSTGGRIVRDAVVRALTILEGSTFCICDERGDVGEDTSGLFAHDTRFLSRAGLTVNGERPLLLSSGKVEYFSAAFYLRNPLAGGLPQDALSIIARALRRRGDAGADRAPQRVDGADLASTLGLEIGTDFADIFSVKEHDFALGDPVHAKPLPPPGRPEYDAENNQFVLAEPERRPRARR